jgi:hypothetical protein
MPHGRSFQPVSDVDVGVDEVSGTGEARRREPAAWFGGCSVKKFCIPACGLTNTFRVTRSSAVTSRIHAYGPALDLCAVPWTTVSSFRSARPRVRR